LNLEYSILKTKNLGMTQEAVYRQHMRTKTFESIRKKDGAKRYALKYALKTRQKQPPAWMNLTGRFWGGDYQTTRMDKSEWETSPLTEKQLRDYLWAFDHRVKKFDVIPKYIFNFPT
jgi:hypothetical protein